MLGAIALPIGKRIDLRRGLLKLDGDGLRALAVQIVRQRLDADSVVGSAVAQPELDAVVHGAKVFPRKPRLECLIGIEDVLTAYLDLVVRAHLGCAVAEDDRVIVL